MAVFISLLYFPFNSKAEAPFSPVSLATGRARVATNNSGTQALSNPASLVHAKAFVSSVIYQGGFVDFSERQEHTTASLIDNGDDIFAAGAFVYSQGKSSFPTLTDFQEERFQISFGKFLFQQFSLGMNINYFLREVHTGDLYRLWDADLGLLWNPRHNFAIGALYESLANHSLKTPESIRPLDRLTLGANYLFMPQFRLRADMTRLTEASSDFGGDWDFRFGLESFIDAWFVFRFGYEAQNSQDRNFYSMGLGFVGPRLNIDYAYRKNRDFSQGELHSVDFRLPF